jgi:hypothetical protein
MTLMECPPLKAQRTLSFGDYLAKLVWLVLRSVGSQQKSAVILRLLIVIALLLTWSTLLALGGCTDFTPSTRSDYHEQQPEYSD